MIATHLDRVSVTYLSEPVFENLSWQIHDDRCVGLVGPNGSGKSTLLKLIAGQLRSDTGFINHRPGLEIGYLPQHPQFDPQGTVLEEALSASQALSQVEADLARVEERLADPAVYEDEKRLNRALAQQARLLEKFTALGGPGYESRCKAVLFSLGFRETDLNQKLENLSGGQKKLVGLAKLLILRPHLLLLDEPDNHLDLAGKTLLETLLQDYSGGVIIVSHDRYLLDVVADEIVELENGRLTHYAGNYSEYAFEKQRRLLQQQHRYQVQQREISRLEEAANRLLTWGRAHDNEKLIKRGKNILKRIDRIDRVDKPVLERKRMRLELKGWRGSNKVLEITNLSKVFPDKSRRAGEEKCLFSGINLLIWHGERVGLVGANGAGKSVLIRMILGEEAISGGEIKLGPSVKVGYYAQEYETLDLSQTPLEAVRLARSISESAAVSFLGRFLFSYEQVSSPMSNLSGGERSRMQLALLMLSDANFLLLDEPTNNLDISSAEVLEQALAEFEGTVLVISHDRYFLDRVTGRVVELAEGMLHEYTGNYSDYLLAKTRNSSS
ncbi:MAG: ABC-F family ATP-binding cassette domain-containing protein [Chloroflexi bacterium]|nr:ABC-F family ATP-binding cassette domain-containing protein [Chloroflexota bacterium]